MNDYLVGAGVAVVVVALIVIWSLAGGLAAAIVAVVGLLAVIAVLLARIAGRSG